MFATNYVIIFIDIYVLKQNNFWLKFFFPVQVHNFSVHLESLSSRGERSRFAAFLQHGRLLVDVYDGDSLLLLGVAKIPLAVSMYVRMCDM